MGEEGNRQSHRTNPAAAFRPLPGRAADTKTYTMCCEEGWMRIGNSNLISHAWLRGNKVVSTKAVSSRWVYVVSR
jgi:hypothetical protein